MIDASFDDCNYADWLDSTDSYFCCTLNDWCDDSSSMLNDWHDSTNGWVDEFTGKIIIDLKLIRFLN